jgi:hypothetical protein
MSEQNNGEGAPPQEQLILGKFKSQEDLVKSYQELEKRVSTPAAPPKLDLAAMQKEFETSGSLSEASLKTLNDFGIPKEFVDGFANGQKAVQELTQFQEREIKSLAGDKWDEMSLWASKNLDAKSLEAYNAAVSSGNYEQAKLAVSKMFEAYTNDVGSKPKERIGSAGSSGTPGQLRTMYDLQRLMNDPRYGKDPGYTQEVENLARESGPLSY